ncbi:hypothetical protein ACSSV4_000621 [Roseovarius sp. MBR-154]|jgi:hypothetical protein
MTDCQICGNTPAPFGQGWPGTPASQPEPVRGRKLRLCAFGGPCHAMAVARVIRAAGQPWPAGGYRGIAAADVAAALGELGFDKAEARRLARA